MDNCPTVLNQLLSKIICYTWIWLKDKLNSPATNWKISSSVRWSSDSQRNKNLDLYVFIFVVGVGLNITLLLFQCSIVSTFHSLDIITVNCIWIVTFIFPPWIWRDLLILFDYFFFWNKSLQKYSKNRISLLSQFIDIKKSQILLLCEMNIIKIGIRISEVVSSAFL